MVATMAAEQKLEAVQFWNTMSEKLQEIVNHSAADISALSLALEKEKVKKTKHNFIFNELFMYFFNYRKQRNAALRQRTLHTRISCPKNQKVVE